MKRALMAVLLIAALGSTGVATTGDLRLGSELVVGEVYELPKKVVLCPEVKPDDPMESLKYMITMPAKTKVEIQAIADKEGNIWASGRPSDPWYLVAIIDAPLKGWEYFGGSPMTEDMARAIIQEGSDYAGWINSSALYSKALRSITTKEAQSVPVESPPEALVADSSQELDEYGFIKKRFGVWEAERRRLWENLMIETGRVSSRAEKRFPLDPECHLESIYTFFSDHRIPVYTMKYAGDGILPLDSIFVAPEGCKISLMRVKPKEGITRYRAEVSFPAGEYEEGWLEGYKRGWLRGVKLGKKKKKEIPRTRFYEQWSSQIEEAQELAVVGEFKAEFEDVKKVDHAEDFVCGFSRGYPLGFRGGWWNGKKNGYKELQRVPDEKGFIMCEDLRGIISVDTTTQTQMKTEIVDRLLADYRNYLCGSHDVLDHEIDSICIEAETKGWTVK